MACVFYILELAFVHIILFAPKFDIDHKRNHTFLFWSFSPTSTGPPKLKIQGQYVHNAIHCSVPIPFFVGWPLDCYYTIIGWIYPQRICTVNPSTILLHYGGCDHILAASCSRQQVEGFKG